MKRLLACLLVLAGMVLAGCEVNADEDVHLSTDVQQIEVTVGH
jgi:outer membrane murein-binding lipoprotein Lpp